MGLVRTAVKTFLSSLFIFYAVSTQEHNPNDDSDEIDWDKVDFYSFSVKDINGKDVPLETYRGKISLVVNVASECGFTESHYRALVKLQEDLAPTGKFNVLAFPCNQFGQQEPGSNDEILQFAKEVYNVNFPMFSKIQVMGDQVPMAWTYLNEHNNFAPNWNFWKYLVDENGHCKGAYGPRTAVEDIRDLIEKEVERIQNASKHSEL